MESIQINDFYDLFKTMHPYNVTIRLLDAPLHEFLPRTKEVFKVYIKYLEGKNIEFDEDELERRIERMVKGVFSKRISMEF